MNAIETRSLGKRYGTVTALSNIDLTVPAGIILGVLGPSGAGKTTLVKCVGLLTTPTSGTLSLFGQAANKHRHHLRQRIGYMPQAAALYEELSARFNISFFSRGTPRKRIAALLELLELAERAGDPVLGFSGGMKQRVSLACALATEPELILLDEPTSGIDPILRQRFWQEFRRLRDEGKTLLVSTHQLDEALHCDKLLVIRQGRILILDTPEALMALGGARVVLERESGERCEVELEHPAEDLPAWLRTHRLEDVTRLSVRNDTLEDVLVRLIEEGSHD